MPLPTAEYKLVSEAAEYIRPLMPFTPRVGIILGTGLGSWLKSLRVEKEITTRDVPNLIQPWVASHKGKLEFAEIEGVPSVIAAGRVHYYEGHSMQEVVRMVRVLYTIGCRYLIITNAAGGLNPDYNAGDIVLIRDHINLMGDNPLRGPNEEQWGPRFPDMTKAYDPDWINFTQQKALTAGMNIPSGVYAGNAGPSLETPAEYKFLHMIGADLVGMSAVPEVIAAQHIGFKTLAMSVVSNVCYPPDRLKETTIEDVVNAVESSAAAVATLLRQAISYTVR